MHSAPAPIQPTTLGRIFAPAGTRTITSRNLETETADPEADPLLSPAPLRSELRHFGRCQRAAILCFRGAGGGRLGDGNAPLIYADLKRSPQIALIDLEGFFGRPGDCIRIYPKEGKVFNKVTVKVTDLCDRLLAHACATDAKRNQQWTFSYFPARRHPETENLIVTVTASHETRKPPKPLLDPYELTPDELGDYYREQEEYNTIFPEEEED